MPENLPDLNEEHNAPVSRLDDDNEPESLAESDPSQGRVGYGRYARFTPLALALGLALVLLGIGLYQRWPVDESVSSSEFTGLPAPGFTMTLLDGSTVTLSQYQGKTVVLNFWASWCVPCRTEMPAFQAVSEDEDEVVVLGAGIKQDNDQNARDLVAELALTYPIGRDTAGSDAITGPIQQAYGVHNFPTTVFIAPDGTVSSMQIGEMTEDQIRDSIERARQ